MATPKEKAILPSAAMTAFDSCLTHAGTSEVNGGVVIHRPEQCTFPNRVGTEQRRSSQFDGNRLTLEPPPIRTDGKPTVSRLVWERVVP